MLRDILHRWFVNYATKIKSDVLLSGTFFSLLCLFYNTE